MFPVIYILLRCYTLLFAESKSYVWSGNISVAISDGQIYAY